MIQSQINFNVVLKRPFTVVDAHLKADIDLYQLKLKHLQKMFSLAKVIVMAMDMARATENLSKLRCKEMFLLKRILIEQDIICLCCRR